MFQKMYLSENLCEKAEWLSRAFSAHDDGSFQPRGEWFVRVIKQMHRNGEMAEVYPNGQMLSNEVYLCHIDEVQMNKSRAAWSIYEFEEFQCD